MTIRREKGHRRQELYSAGERSRAENSWTWVCECGATESGSTKAIALDEWRWHLRAARERRIRLAEGEES